MSGRLVGVSLLLLSPWLAAQQAQNNESIIKLVKAGLSDDLIISAINSSPGSYNTSADGLIALKGAGASDKVVAAILVKNSGGSVSAAPAPTAPAPSAPALPPGIDSEGVYYKESGDTWQDVPVEVVNFKTGGVVKHVASVGIVKGDLNGHIGGNKSKLALKAPVSFIIYLPEGRSAGEYQLLRLRVNENSREFRSVTGGVFHVSGGAIRDDVDFTSKKIAPRVYEITLGADIGKAEYGFLPPLDNVSQKNLASSGKICTFSLNP
jgi:hypothetical protein